jgi:hypothetical protein
MHNPLHSVCLILIVFFVLFGESQSFILFSTNNKPHERAADIDEQQTKQTAYVKSTKIVNGVTYEYVFENGNLLAMNMNKGKQIESEQPPPNHQTELIFSLIFFC